MLNSVLQRYVVHHKQLEQRMDGSAGGAFSALLETVAKEGYYFCGTVYDDQLHVHHKVTNNPEEISELAGYKLVQSDCAEALLQIEQLLKKGEKVLFCGTPVQCDELRNLVGDIESLILVDVIHSPFVAQSLFDKYTEEMAAANNAKVTHIRFYNKEHIYNRSKRVTLDNGRTLYFYEKDDFDDLVDTGRFSIQESSDEQYTSLDERVGDITIGSYRLNKDNDGLGYSYLSVNSQKGAELFEKTRKRLVIDVDGDGVDIDAIRYRNGKCVSHINTEEIENKSLYQLAHAKEKNTIRQRIINRVRPFVYGLLAARWNPFVYAKFIRLNFFTKGVHVDYENKGFIYLTGHCAVKLVKGFSIELHGPLTLGTRRIKESRQETRLRMEKGARLLVKHNCTFGAGSNVEIYKNAFLEVGNISSNAELNIICGLHIKTGDTCNIARNATIRDTSGHLIALPGYKMARPIEIGNHTWICTESVIMPGVKIGDGAIVGACSYVTKNVEPFTLVQGSPAQPVGTPKYFKI